MTIRNRNRKNPSFIMLIMATAMLLAAVNPLLARERKTYYDPRTYARAEVTKVERAGDEGSPTAETRVHVRVLDGERKGENFISVYRGDDDMPEGMFYREGDRVFIGISRSEGADSVEYISLYDVDNTTGIIILGLLLVITIVAVGRLRGVMSMLSLVATIVLIFFILIPMTLKGHSPLPIAVAISLFAMVVTIPIIVGLRIKALAAILGGSLGVVLATTLALLCGLFMHLSGIVTNEMMTVFYASSVDVDLRGLALAGIVIAALGAIMDVCISIASAAEEIFHVNPHISKGEAFSSIMTVSSDMLGATVNTLLFAYVGSALPMVLLIAMRIQPDMPAWLIFNYNPVLSELVKSAVGCIGMFLSMPATALISIYLHGRRQKINLKNRSHGGTETQRV